MHYYEYNEIDEKERVQRRKEAKKKRENSRGDKTKQNKTKQESRVRLLNNLTIK